MAAQAVGITAAIRMLMMISDNGKYQAQRFQRAADVFAGDGVLLHDRPFFWGEIRPFFQDFIGHGDFSQVVEIAAAAQGHNRFFCQSQMASKIAGVLGQPFDVAPIVAAARRAPSAALALPHGLDQATFSLQKEVRP